MLYFSLLWRYGVDMIFLKIIRKIKQKNRNRMLWDKKNKIKLEK